jgi:hypothetical protein
MGVKGVPHLSRETWLAHGTSRGSNGAASVSERWAAASLPDPRSLTVAARRVPAPMRAIHSFGALDGV